MIEWPQDWFDQFWAAYPRKEGKLAALREAEIVRRNYLSGTPFEEFLFAVQSYAVQCRGTERRFIAHPRTWLHQGRWLDEHPQPREENTWKVDRAVAETLRRRMQ